MEEFFKLALENISKYGDTDIFPFPVEKNIFFDCKENSIKLLGEIHSKLDEFLSSNPPVNLSTLCPVGYTGFRWGTQIDPIWNAYFLSLVLKVAGEIEKNRIKVEDETVFSYRVKLEEDSPKLFNENIGWNEFQLKSIDFCNKDNNKYILICDISDFYSRIYHHRLENSLNKLELGCDTTFRIMKLLQRFSGNKSYGLPVGGNGARILSELLLNNTDKLLKMKGIKFCRFADDYHIFANSVENAYQHLITLSELLLRNEGLALQKSKTRIMPSDEFKNNSEIYGSIEKKNNDPKIQFLRMNLNFDPYSATAIDDYEELKEQVNKFDILGMLKSELTSKSQIHKHLVSKLLKAINHLDPKVKAEAVLTLLSNLELLAPVFPQVMQLLQRIFDSLDENTQNKTQQIIRELIIKQHYLVKIELNLHFAILVLGLQRSEENEYLLNKVFETNGAEFVRKDIIHIFTKWNSYHWVSDLRGSFSQLKTWEKRSFIIASYILGDEGKHWRDHFKKNFSSIDDLYKDWASHKKNTSGFGSLV